MAYVNSSKQRFDLVGEVLSFAANAINSASQKHKERQIYRHTMSELQSLSNRELADLGINRSELKRIAWASATGSDIRA